MRIGTTMLMGGIVALVTGLVFRMNRSRMWRQMMRRIRWNRLLSKMSRSWLRRSWMG